MKPCTQYLLLLTFLGLTFLIKSADSFPMRPNQSQLEEKARQIYPREAAEVFFPTNGYLIASRFCYLTGEVHLADGIVSIYISSSQLGCLRCCVPRDTINQRALSTNRVVQNIHDKTLFGHWLTEIVTLAARIIKVAMYGNQWDIMKRNAGTVDSLLNLPDLSVGRR